MKIYVDLHIHSCLSPCGDADMIPYNICAMAQLKGLDAIAVTDHNSALNLPSAQAAADFFHLQFLAGMEITTKEEVHILAYFPRVDGALKAGEEIAKHLPKMKNKPSFFGHQHIVDENHQIVGEEEALLIGATDLSIYEVGELIRGFGGIYVPAHINRGNFGLLQKFGFLPVDMDLPLLEVDPSLPVDLNIVKGKKIINASDAHQLGNIMERQFYLETQETKAETKGDLFNVLAEYFNQYKRE